MLCALCCSSASSLACWIVTAHKRSLRRLCFYRCLSVHTGGKRGCSGGVRGCSWGHAWLLRGRGQAWLLARGMHGCFGGGACVVALGGHRWLLLAGVCMVALGGCVVTARVHAWLLQGGMRGCPWGGMHGIRWDTEIRSMSGWYASYWNAFLFSIKFAGLRAGTVNSPFLSYIIIAKHVCHERRSL